MQVFQTAGVPPREGRIIFAIIGWTRKSSVALTKRVMANRNAKEGSPRFQRLGKGSVPFFNASVPLEDTKQVRIIIRPDPDLGPVLDRLPAQIMGKLAE